MKIPHGKDLAFLMLVAAFVLIVGIAAAFFFLTGAGARMGMVGIVVFLLALFLVGLGVSSRSPGEKIERD